MSKKITLENDGKNNFNVLMGFVNKLTLWFVTDLVGRLVSYLCFGHYIFDALARTCAVLYMAITGLGLFNFHFR